jgi:hypothetical protein
MSYFKDIDTWLDALLAPFPTETEIRRMRKEIKAKLLEVIPERPIRSPAPR